MRSKTNSISFNVYTSFPLDFEIMRLQIYSFSLDEKPAGTSRTGDGFAVATGGIAC